jgi:glycine/D-amino acid oxidase-like deaminating enzyme
MPEFRRLNRLAASCARQSSKPVTEIVMKNRLNRRQFLRHGIYAGTALGLGMGCTQKTPEGPLLPEERKFAKANVSWDRIIRTSVGLRPARSSGFLIRKEKLGDKTVIHNYGHGSRGVTLCWGTSHMAVDEALPTGQTRYAVIGCGAVGLATARLLQERGFDVTIYARDLPPDTTSDHAEAIWDAGDNPEPGGLWMRAVRLSHSYYTKMLGEHYGVRWIEYYSRYWEELRLTHAPGHPLGEFYRDFRQFDEDELPFNTPSVIRWSTLQIEPPIYMKAVLEDFLSTRGKVVVRDFADLRSVLELPEPVIMNCSGLGAKFLFDDEEMFPVKGQLTILLPQPEIDYIVDIPGSVVPRRDGLVLGGTWEPGEWSLEPNMEALHKIMNRHMDFASRMK